MTERVHHEAEAAEELGAATEARASTALALPRAPDAAAADGGNRAVTALAGAARLLISRIGTPLSEPLAATDPKPKFGEDAGEQRRYRRQAVRGDVGGRSRAGS